MNKIDFKKELKHLYNTSAKEVSVVEVPAFNYLMIDGKGDPNACAEFTQAIEALYAVAYTLKFMIKKGSDGIDYGVMPLEGLWWAEDMSSFQEARKDEWLWTLMIMQPQFIAADLFEAAVAAVAKKKNPTALKKIRLDSLAEGKAAQIMYIGPYSDEGPTIEKLHTYINEKGCKLSGKHHEIYLSDARRTAPEKLRTIIRQPLKEHK